MKKFLKSKSTSIENDTQIVQIRKQNKIERRANESKEISIQ